MKIPFSKKAYRFDAEAAGDRAHGYEAPDGTILRWSFARLSVAQACGVHIVRLGDLAFEGDELLPYHGFLEDMQRVLHIAALDDDGVDDARWNVRQTVRHASTFMDSRGVRLHSPEFGQWVEVYVRMLCDAMLSEAEPMSSEGTAGGTAGESSAESATS